VLPKIPQTCVRIIYSDLLSPTNKHIVRIVPSKCPDIDRIDANVQNPFGVNTVAHDLGRFFGFDGVFVIDNGMCSLF
jgi:hypothetical protein